LQIILQHLGGRGPIRAPEVLDGNAGGISFSDGDRGSLLGKKWSNAE
jgi:hypothetical protein